MPVNLEKFQATLRYEFRDCRHLQLALRHRSVGSDNNERLEFLGDSILNFCITEKLFEVRPNESEGELSRIRASLVNGESLATIAEQLQLGHYIELGQGEQRSGGKQRKSILADAMEAVLGAVLRDGGFDVCRKLILDLYQPLLLNLPSAEELKDPKTRLQELLQGRGEALPRYEVVAETGMDHQKQFEVNCLVAGVKSTMAIGSSRRKAEQLAAQKMLANLTNV